MRSSVSRTSLALAVALGAALAPRALAQDSTPAPQRALDALLATSWDSKSQTFSRNTDGSGHAEFWWEAHFLETALDAWQATHDPRDRALVDQIYEGFLREHPDWKVSASEDNHFDDDLGWWALALAHAYDVTHEDRFRAHSVALFQSISAFEDPTYGGGLWWRRDGNDPQKNMATNAPYVMTAVELARITGDPAYLAKAREVYAWIQSRLVNPDGSVGDRVEGAGAGHFIDGQLSYNYGTYVGASLALAQATGDPGYLANAERAADHEMAAHPILAAEGDDDGAGFKMIFTRNVARLAQVESPAERARITDYLDRNAQAAWDHRNQDGLTGQDWMQRAPGVVQTFAAASAIDAETAPSIARQPGTPLALRPPIANAPLGGDPADEPASQAPVGIPGPGATPGVIVAPIANATLHGLSTETAHEDLAGGSHVAGWDRDGQWVDFHVTVPADGVYTLGIRYAAGAGDASRYVYVNGRGVVDDLRFQGTGSWDDAHMVAVPTVRLHAGENVISVIYDSSKGSSNFVNVDRLTVGPSPAGLAGGVTRAPSEGLIQKIEGFFGL